MFYVWKPILWIYPLTHSTQFLKHISPEMFVVKDVWCSDVVVAMNLFQTKKPFANHHDRQNFLSESLEYLFMMEVVELTIGNDTFIKSFPNTRQTHEFQPILPFVLVLLYRLKLFWRFRYKDWKCAKSRSPNCLPSCQRRPSKCTKYNCGNYRWQISGWRSTGVSSSKAKRSNCKWKHAENV